MNRRSQQKLSTRANIKRTARAAFLERGVEATTTREISRLAGVAVGTFFVHFPDKLDLVKEIFFDEMDSALSAGVGQQSPTSSPTEYMVQIAQVLFTFYSKYSEFTRMIMLDSVSSGGFHAQQMSSVRDGLASRFEAVNIDANTASIFAENVIANYWLVFMECLPSGKFDAPATMQRLNNLNLPFKISYDNAARK
ncbi:TetR/AcrR family transcriptional regulator [Marinomonas piezotolerans]|uniref:TetR/AcrR family transcriptional regulator n=1 Tax=Marinomonas piezotolerans TaxID=2213058 RepID=A0A370UD42_9GAMM|nr:TetR/AcrR family transcriptional regulator [Marinomonas piezotolerans]RDL45706.1 TetR/AcrR family transcriptional regulator [Marinomonas piezotolerans]